MMIYLHTMVMIRTSAPLVSAEACGRACAVAHLQTACSRLPMTSILIKSNVCSIGPSRAPRRWALHLVRLHCFSSPASL